MSELEQQRKQLVKRMADAKPERLPMPEDTKRKLEQVKDPSLREYLRDLWANLKPEHLMRQLADLDDRIALETQHDLDRRMYAKAEAGDYGRTVKDMTDQVQRPGSPDTDGNRKAWDDVRKSFNEDRTDN